MMSWLISWLDNKQPSVPKTALTPSATLPTAPITDSSSSSPHPNINAAVDTNTIPTIVFAVHNITAITTPAQSHPASVVVDKAQQLMGVKPKDTTAKTELVIPYEVLRHILPFCTKSTLSTLITTDHRFSRYVEIELYRHISILSTPKVETLLFGPVLPVAQNISNHPFYRVLRALAANPERASWIKNLELEIITDSPLLHPGVELILQFCQHHLEKLHLKFKRRQFAADGPWVVQASLTRLTRLDLTGVTDRGLPWFLDILSKAPKVHTLRIDSQNVRDTNEFINASQPTLAASYPNIRVLRLTHFGQFFPNHLLRLMRNADNLEILVWNQNISMVHRPGGGRERNEDAWGVISRKKTLRSFVWRLGTCREFAALVRQREGFEGLVEVVLGDQDLRGVYPGPKSIHIPRLSTLKSIFIYVDQSPKQQTQHQTALSSIIPTFPWKSPIEIPQAFIEQLLLAPSLLSIRISTINPGYDRIRPNAQSWERNKASGYLIRTYTNGVDNLVVLRSRFQTTGYWLTYADFNGHTVKDQRLEKVMDMMGEQYKWIHPGRGLELSEEAWKLLRA